MAWRRLAASVPRSLAGAAAGALAYAAYPLYPAVEAERAIGYDSIGYGTGAERAPVPGVRETERIERIGAHTPGESAAGSRRPKTVAEATEDLNKARKRIAVFGGSFNPVTNAHLNCAAEIIHSKLADEVWITPCGQRPDKPSLRTPGLHRLIMCHLAVDTTFGSRFGVKVCDEEMHEPRNIPTIILMRRLKAKYPDYDFSFVVGSDLIPTLHEWEAPSCSGRWEGISNAGKAFMEENHFLVIDRPGEGEEVTVPESANFEMIAPALEARGSRLTETLLSSSEVRLRIRGADDIVRYGLRKGGEVGEKTSQPSVSDSRSWYDEVEGLVPPSVLGHIVRYKLYSREDAPQSD